MVDLGTAALVGRPPSTSTTPWAGCVSAAASVAPTARPRRPCPPCARRPHPAAHGPARGARPQAPGAADHAAAPERRRTTSSPPRTSCSATASTYAAPGGEWQSLTRRLASVPARRRPVGAPPPRGGPGQAARVTAAGAGRPAGRRDRHPVERLEPGRPATDVLAARAGASRSSRRRSRSSLRLGLRARARVPAPAAVQPHLPAARARGRPRRWRPRARRPRGRRGSPPS